jgi:tRNA (guanine-N7-)-methyltransferase
MESFGHVIQPAFEEVFRKDFKLKGCWRKEFFNNNYPIILELGCGKGEYSVELARQNTDKNYIGIDIKGARMWRGAKTAFEERLKNICFLRTRIELIESFFTTAEIDEIWITFPDPQLKKKRNKKRLTGARFLNSYSNILKPDGLIHLKTDSRQLFDYTLELARQNKLQLLKSTNDLYSDPEADNRLFIKTHYEKIFLEQGKKITYLCLRLKPGQSVEEIKDDDKE